MSGDRVHALEQQLGQTEGERDAALRRAREAERELRELLAENERLRTALDLADRQVRALGRLADQRGAELLRLGDALDEAAPGLGVQR